MTILELGPEQFGYMRLVEQIGCQFSGTPLEQTWIMVQQINLMNKQHYIKGILEQLWNQLNVQVPANEDFMRGIVKTLATIAVFFGVNNGRSIRGVDIWSSPSVTQALQLIFNVLKYNNNHETLLCATGVGCAIIFYEALKKLSTTPASSQSKKETRTPAERLQRLMDMPIADNLSSVLY